MATLAAPAHPLHEDALALFTGTLLAALGIVLLKHGGLLPGGTVGIALLGHYLTGLDLSLTFLLANVPFYALATLRMGREFTLKTLAGVALTSLFAWLLPRGLAIDHVSPLVAAVMGGLLAGVGILVLFRHRASLGGLNIVVLYLQDRFGWRPGVTQMALDAVVVIGGGLWATDLTRVAYSVLSVVTLNLVLAVNHRPERYRALA
jgi:uncharacterized membrane-anchored protein YitT (DUF2179 family)